MVEKCVICLGPIAEDEPLVNCGLGPEHVDCHEDDDEYDPQHSAASEADR